MKDEMFHPLDVAEWLRFDAATNPYGPSPKVREAMAAFARIGDFSRYDDEERAESLRGDLAAYWGLSPDHFIVYNGSGEAVVWLFLARLLLEQQRLLIPSPSYERFVALGQRCAAEVIPVPLHEEDFALVPERFIESGRQSGARVLLLSSPNNPTGNLLCGDAEMARLLDELPNCLCIVDEAYADYAGYSYVPWAQERENLVVLRTFSKAYGMAGLRVGYAIGPKPVIAALSQMQVPWAVNALSLVAAQAALADQSYLQEVVVQIRSDCQALYEGLNERPWLRAYPSAANFFWVRCEGIGPERLRTGLEKRQIRARWRQDAPDFVRLTSLRPQDNEYLLAALDEVGQSD